MAGEYRVYVGTYTEAIQFGTGEIYQGQGEGIHLFRFSSDQASLTPVSVTRGVKNPSFLCLAPSHRFLYAVNELKSLEHGEGGMISAFSIDAESGELTFLNSKSTRGMDPCHVATTRDGTHVMVANYMSGSVIVYPVEQDGRLGDESAFVQHSGSSVHLTRQTGPHAHASVFDAANQFVFVPDLGVDRVVAYRFDLPSGSLRPVDGASLSMKPGAGPRHIAFSNDGGFAYVVNELDSTLTMCRYDAVSGILSPEQTLSTLPEGFDGESSCADIHLHPSGSFVYVSNRGHDSIALFRRDHVTGMLEPLGHQMTGGETPRNFAIEPEGRVMLVANQASNHIVLFSINTESGELTPTGRETRVGSPVCIQIVPV